MRYWIKLYTEILHDPKMGRLTDRQFRVCINLFALAGELDADGNLPATSDLAWLLRLPEADLLADLHALAEVNILCATADGWHVTHWTTRQARPPSSTRENVRARVQASRGCNEDVTTLHPRYTENVTPPDQIRSDQIRSEAETETDHAPAAQDNDDPDPVTRAIRNAYDACGLMMTKTHLDAHRETIARCGLPAWQKGFTVALDASKHNIPSYVARCAESAMLAAQRGNGNGKPKVDQSFEALQKRYG